MNFYKHHIGDYAQATAHLSFIEDAAYVRCLRKYYAEEKPLPADVKAVQRLIGARTREEREAVQTILDEFFTLQDDGWHNKRADAELVKANAQAETNRRIAEEREARRKAREETNESSTNRARIDNESLHESSASREPSQTPDSRRQTPDSTTSDRGERRASAPPPRPPDVDAQVWADWLTLRKAKKAPVTATTVDRAAEEAGKAGMTLDAFLREWCARGSQGLQADWIKPNGRPVGASPAQSRQAAIEAHNAAVAQRIKERLRAESA